MQFFGGSLNAFYIWLILAVVLLGGEMLSGVLAFACGALGALLAGLAAWAGGGLAWQLAGLAAGLVAGWFVLKPLAERYWLHPPSAQLETNVYGLIGRRGVVLEEISGLENRGRVRVGSEDWKALPADGEAVVPAGAHVRVAAVRGSSVIVEFEAAAAEALSAS